VSKQDGTPMNDIEVQYVSFHLGEHFYAKYAIIIKLQ
jgi:hypothetical protein